MRFARATVTETSVLTQRLTRIVFDVPELHRLGLPDVADAAVGVYFPTDGGRHTPDPHRSDGTWGYHDGRSAPQGRNYSVRFHDGGTLLTMDVVVHTRGPGSDWARRAVRGDSVVLGHSRAWYRPAPGTQWQLLVADLAGLPAMARIIEASPPQARILAVYEVPDETDLAYLPTAPNVTHVTAVGSGNGHPRSELAELVARQPHPPGRGYCWFGGEAGQSRSVRKHLRSLGWTAEQFDIVGYWRLDSENWDRRFGAVGTELVAVYEKALADGKGQKVAAEEFDDALERAGL